MIRYENHCVGCRSMGLPCLGASCSNKNVPVYYCDTCGEELNPDEMYEVDDEDLCEECLKERFRKCD